MFQDDMCLALCLKPEVKQKLILSCGFHVFGQRQKRKRPRRDLPGGGRLSSGLLSVKVLSARHLTEAI